MKKRTVETIAIAVRESEEKIREKLEQLIVLARDPQIRTLLMKIERRLDQAPPAPDIAEIRKINQSICEILKSFQLNYAKEQIQEINQETSEIIDYLLNERANLVVLQSCDLDEKSALKAFRKNKRDPRTEEEFLEDFRFEQQDQQELSERIELLLQAANAYSLTCTVLDAQHALDEIAKKKEALSERYDAARNDMERDTIEIELEGLYDEEEAHTEVLQENQKAVQDINYYKICLSKYRKKAAAAQKRPKKIAWEQLTDKTSKQTKENNKDQQAIEEYKGRLRDLTQSNIRGRTGRPTMAEIKARQMNDSLIVDDGEAKIDQAAKTVRDKTE